MHLLVVELMIVREMMNVLHLFVPGFFFADQYATVRSDSVINNFQLPIRAWYNIISTPRNTSKYGSHE